MKNRNILVSSIASLFWLFFMLAAALPEHFWGLHHFSYLPVGLKVVFASLSVAFIWILPQLVAFLKNRLHFPLNRLAFISFGALIFGILIYSFPMSASLYGDAELFKERMGERTTEFDQKFVYSLFSPDISSPKTGNHTVLSAVRLISYYLEISHQSAYFIIGLSCGLLYSIVWLQFVFSAFESLTLRIAFGFAGLLAPYTQFFYGYEEIYAPAYLFTTALLIMWVRFFRSPTSARLIGLIAIQFLASKFHSASWLLLPASCLSIVYFCKNKLTFITPLFQWRMIALFVVLPVIGCGAFVYFFVLSDHIDERFVNDSVNIYDRLFLPLFAPDPPYDRYTLLSFNHLFDSVNLWFMWCPPALYITCLVVFVYRPRFGWNRPHFLMIGLSLIFYLLLFFMVNPLMSMPIDIDYFSLGGPVLLVFGLELAKMVDLKQIKYQLSGAILGLSLLSFPVIYVNATEEALGVRLMDVGKQVYTGYWIRSAGTFMNGLNLAESQDSVKITRLEAFVKDAQPYALIGKDREFAVLCMELAKLYRKQQVNQDLALKYHRLAEKYDSSLIANYIGLMEIEFYNKNYANALEYAQILVEHNYPSEKQALRIALEIALSANYQKVSLELLDRYLLKWQDEDALIARERLMQSE